MSEKNLWMLHIQGPDDIVAAPSREEADTVAAAFNGYWGAYLAKQRAQSITDGRNPDHWPSVSAAVTEWTGTAREHAHSVEKYWPDYAEYLKLQEPQS
ncbi:MULTISPECIES: hypothetical protein [unclassified Caballeronia]|uniref:hypothetical protein n=1 Tax=unclassified Caballeronia TaxID=2646786 RepID=UPI00202850E6|nr:MULTISPECIES: hypothetical protein [unclassified Caballeronia]